VLRGRWKERVFQLKVPVVVPNAAENAMIATTRESWHKRLGHIPEKRILELEKPKLVKGLESQTGTYKLMSRLRPR